MPNVKVKNVSNHATQIRSRNDSIQIQPNSVVEVEDSFLYNYDRKAIRLLGVKSTENPLIVSPVNNSDVV